MEVRNNNQKQPSSVRGNRARCINYSSCPLCYGCRNCNSKDYDCLECEREDNLRGRKYNVCNTKLHEAWKINKIITKNTIKLDIDDMEENE